MLVFLVMDGFFLFVEDGGIYLIELFFFIGNMIVIVVV